MPDRALSTALDDSFERYLQDKGKGRGGDGGNYRRNAARELERFAEWAAGDRGDDHWTGSSPTTSTGSQPSTISTNACSESTPGILVEIGDLSRTRYKPITAISLRGAGGVSTRGISRPITRSERVRWRRCRKDDGRKPGDQQAWTSEQRHALTRHVDERARDAVEVHDTPGGY